MALSHMNPEETVKAFLIKYNGCFFVFLFIINIKLWIGYDEHSN